MYISIIIPTYNRSVVLDDTLFSFLEIKNHDKIFEILIIDNNSTDKTREVAEKYSTLLPLKYFFENRQGKNYAVNLGIDKSIGDILVFVDDDITIKKIGLNLFCYHCKTILKLIYSVVKF